MGQIEQVKVPDIGDFEAVEVVEVLVAPGDAVEADDSLITLESDKATMDVPSPAAGTVRQLQVTAGDEVSEGDVILSLELAEATEKGEAAEAPAEEEPEAEEKAEAAEAPGEAEPEAEAEQGEARRVEETSPARRREEEREEPVDAQGFRYAHASPAVRRFARELGADLTRIEGSGRKGRITREDVQAYVKGRLERSEAVPAGGPAVPEMPTIDFTKFGDVEERPLSRIRRRSAENLHRSWLTVPHVTQHDEADITELEAFRRTMKEEAAEQGVKLTFLPFLMKASVAALKQFPEVNASLTPDGERLVLKRYYHLGIAVDTDEGLVVPVIRDVDDKGLLDLARELAEVSSRARDGKLRPDDLQGASFTISSLGGIGGTAFTPIVNAPEVAILGVSRTRTQPVWRDGAFVPRRILPLSLSYDHRVVDGALAARFTTHLAGLLGDLRRLLL